MATYKLVDEEKLDAAMTATADAIRAKTGSTDPIAWDAEKGMSEAVDPVFEAGKKAEYDAFWDAYQDYGNRSNYRYAFSYHGWKDDNFFPKYDIDLTNAASLFQSSNITNLKDKLIQQGVKLDSSSCKLLLQMFQNSYILHIPELDISEVTNSSYAFASDSIATIDKLIVSENTIISENMFVNANGLIEITFEGALAMTIDLHWSPLSKASILSTITALSDSTSGLTASFSLTAVNNAFETTAGAADGSTSEEWTTLIATKPNWTIALADA